MISQEERDWIEHVQAVDDTIYQQCVTKPGANVATYSFTPDAKHATDTEAMSYHEWPDVGEVDFLCVRYEFAKSHFPFHYLRFWTQKLRVGGRLLLFSPKRTENWLVQDGLECLDIYLAELGFSLSESLPLAEEYWANASIWTRTQWGLQSIGWRDVVSVHAGCVSVQTGHRTYGVLVAGPHGMGKTSVIIRLLRDSWKSEERPEAARSGPGTGSRPPVHFVADAWTDISSTGGAHGLLADHRPLRVRRVDSTRWQLSPSSARDQEKDRWRLADLLPGLETVPRLATSRPELVLWPALHGTTRHSDCVEASPDRSYAPFAPSSHARRRQRLSEETGMNHLGHNLPIMRTLRGTIIDGLASLPHYDVLTTRFCLEHLQEILLSMKNTGADGGMTCLT